MHDTIIIKDILIDIINTTPENYFGLAEYTKIKSIDSGAICQNYSFDLVATREIIKLNKFITRKDGAKQEFIFGISDVAADKFPIFRITKDIIEENSELNKEIMHITESNKLLKSELEIKQFALDYYRNNKLIKFLCFLKLI